MSAKPMNESEGKIVQSAALNVSDDSGDQVEETKTQLKVDSATSIPSLSLSATSSSQKKAKEGHDYSEVSPNKRYIRFNEKYSNTANIKASYRGFDTKNGIEVVWQKIYLSNLGEAEQEPIMRSLNYLKDIQQKHIVEYLSIWMTEEPRTVNLITTYLDPLEKFLAKVKTLRWRIIKKWCKQLLTGLNYLHTSSPVIVHRNLNLGNIFMNSGLGEIYLGGMWLSAVLASGSEEVSMSALISTYCYQGRQPGSPAYKAPEVLANQPLTTKVDIYSFGMCLLVLLTREDPYVEVYGVHSLKHKDSSGCDERQSDSFNDCLTADEEAERREGYAAITSLITKGVLPEALERVTQSHPAAGAFLRLCLALDPRDRKSAEELLADDFLQTGDGESRDDSVVIKPVIKSTEGGRMRVSSSGGGEGHSVSDSLVKVEVEVEDSVTSNMGSAQHSPKDSAANPTSSSAVSVSASSPLLNAVTELNVERSQSPSPNAVPESLSFSEINQTGQSPASAVATTEEFASLTVNVATGTKMSHEIGHDVSPVADSSIISAPVSPTEVLAVPSSDKPAAETVSTSTNKEESSLVKELAKLGTSDDVNQDRGIHDGRRAKSGERQKKIDLKKEVQERAQSVLHSIEGATVAAAAGGAGAVVVQLHIEGRYTSDGINKEVEFTFEKGSDQVEVIAAEMKEELHLNLSVDNLVSLIQDIIHDKESGAVSQCDNQSDSNLGKSTPPVTSSSSVPVPTTKATNDRELKVDIAIAENKVEACDATISPGANHSITDRAEDQAGQSVISLTLSKSVSGEQEISPAIVMTSPADDIQEDCVDTALSSDHSTKPPNAHLSVSEQKQRQGTEARTSPTDTTCQSNFSSPDNSTAAVVSDKHSPIVIANITESPSSSIAATSITLPVTPLSNIPTNRASAVASPSSPTRHSGGSTQRVVPMLEEDAPSAEVADYHTYLKEIEAIEKESRAASRVFEQRIQKHKIIQETCEEDLVKVEADFGGQKAKLDNKQIREDKKRDEELSQLRAELDKSLLDLKMAIASRRHHHEDLEEGNFAGVSSGQISNSIPGIVVTSPPMVANSTSSGHISNAFASFDSSLNPASVSVTTSSTTTSGSSKSCDSPEKHRQQQNIHHHQQKQHAYQSSAGTISNSRSRSSSNISQMFMDASYNQGSAHSGNGGAGGSCGSNNSSSSSSSSGSGTNVHISNGGSDFGDASSESSVPPTVHYPC